MSATLIVHLDGGIARARACLEALASLDADPPFEAIVVDDASPDLRPLLDALEGDVHTLRNDRPLGLAASAAAAAQQATTDTLVLLRNAPLLAPDALAPLLHALGKTDLAGAAALSVPTPATSDPSPVSLPHPVSTQALALRRADADVLAGAATAPADLEMAAICAELATRGRVATIPASVATPSQPRAVSARATPGDPAELTVVIPTLDAACDRVRACIAAVQNTTEAPHQIVVVDNGAPPQGFTAPVNAGLRAVETPYAVVMNDDVEPLPGWWPPLRAALDAGAAVSFPLTVEGGMREDFAAWCFALSADTIEEMSHAPGQFFDPALRVWFQDTDLLARLRALGNPPRLVRESRIRHALSATVRSEDPQLRAWIEATVRADRAAFLAKHPDYAGAVPA